VQVVANRRFGLRIAGIVAAMLVLALVVVLPILRDQRGSEITRYRNALLATRGNAADFAWTPANWPRDFQRERVEVPASLQQWHGLQVNRDATPWQRTLSFARALTEQPFMGGVIARPTLETLQLIETTGTGYCADYTKVLNALGYAAGIPIRQWSFSYDGFGGRGHTFNEIWDEQNQRWRMIDAFHGFYPRDLSSGEALSALDFRDRLLTAPHTIRWQWLKPEPSEFTNDAEALKYFQKGVNEWYLWWGNDPLSYDANSLVAFAGRFGRLPEQVAGLLTGALPGFKILVTQDNEAAVVRIERLRVYLLAAATGEMLLLVLLIWQLLAWRNAGRRTKW